MPQSKKSKPPSQSSKRPLHHSVLFSTASGALAQWSLAIYPDEPGPVLGPITFGGVWLAWYLFFGVLYGPVEAQEANKDVEERDEI
jgi:polyferredoxin